VNIDWMRQKLQDFRTLCDEHEAARGTGYKGSRGTGYATDSSVTTKPIGDQILDALPTVEQIIRHLDPTLLTDGFGKDRYPDGYFETARQTRMAIAVLRDREEWKTNLAPDSPSISADELHPTVWNAAATVWETDEYKLAAQQACVSLSAHIKAKAGSHLNDRDLVAQVFKPEPPTSTQKRLHLPGNPADRNWQSRQQGLHHLAQGAFAGIRNIAAHDKTAWSEHEALEHLAVLSVVARWADETQRVSV
jgi:uncharacterized protein (TIGR02391 family)